MSKVDQASAAALAGIEIAEKRIQALAFAMEGLNEYDAKSCREEYNKLWVILHQNLNEQYRRFLMWGVIKPKLRLAAKELAMKHYIRKCSDIMGYLNPDGMCHNYFETDKKEFEKEIEYLRKELNK